MKILYNVIQFCDQEAEKGEIIVPIAYSTKQGGQIPSVSSSTIKKFRQEARDECNPVFCLPKKRV